MSRFVMLVGLPASGKSSLSIFLKAVDFNVHSSDTIRKELLGDQKDQTKNDVVFNILHKRIKEDLKNGVDTLYDATNISQKRRIAFLKEIQKYDVVKECHFMATPYEVCVERDAIRENSVGKTVIDRMYKSFWVPQYYEGWDKIVIHWDASIANNFKNVNEFLDSIAEFDQKTPYHNLMLDKHMKEAYNWGVEKLVERDLKPKDYENLLLAIRLHDIGKPFTQEYNVKKERCTYYQHHLTGAYDSLFYTKTLHLFKPIIRGYSQKPKSNDEILEIADLIQNHMKPYDIKQESTKKRFISLVGQKKYSEIMFMHGADQATH